jgi:hypothetical protein
LFSQSFFAKSGWPFGRILLNCFKPILFTVLAAMIGAGVILWDPTFQRWPFRSYAVSSPYLSDPARHHPGDLHCIA